MSEPEITEAMREDAAAAIFCHAQFSGDVHTARRLADQALTAALSAAEDEADIRDGLEAIKEPDRETLAQLKTRLALSADRGRAIEGLPVDVTDDELKDVVAHLRGLRDGPTTYRPINGRWQCFHCGEIFTTHQGALLHFGTPEATQPICVDLADAVLSCPQPGEGVRAAAEIEAARLVDLCRFSRAGVKQETLDYNFDNSRHQCIQIVTRSLSAAQTRPLEGEWKDLIERLLGGSDDHITSMALRREAAHALSSPSPQSAAGERCQICCESGKNCLRGATDLYAGEVIERFVNIARDPALWEPQPGRTYFPANAMHREAGEAIALAAIRSLPSTGYRAGEKS